MNALAVFACTLMTSEMELKQTQQSETPKKEMVSESQEYDLSLKELHPQSATHCQWNLMKLMRVRHRGRATDR